MPTKDQLRRKLRDLTGQVPSSRLSKAELEDQIAAAARPEPQCSEECKVLAEMYEQRAMRLVASVKKMDGYAAHTYRGLFSDALHVVVTLPNKARVELSVLPSEELQGLERAKITRFWRFERVPYESDRAYADLLITIHRTMGKATA